MKNRLYMPFIVGVLVLFAFSGCPKGKEKPSELFKNDQSETTTPHGTIDQDSVRDSGDGTVSYRTSDGKDWRTRMKKRRDGSRTWSEPEPVEPSQ